MTEQTRTPEELLAPSAINSLVKYGIDEFVYYLNYYKIPYDSILSYKKNIRNNITTLLQPDSPLYRKTYTSHEANNLVIYAVHLAYISHLLSLLNMFRGSARIKDLLEKGVTD